MKNFFNNLNVNKTIFCFLLSLTACSPKKSNSPAPGPVPSSWVQEQVPSQGPSTPVSQEQKDKLSQSFSDILEATHEAIELGTVSEAQLQSIYPMGLGPFGASDSKSGIVDPEPKDRPADWVPWRAEYFMTDFSVSLSGAIGLVALKGTSTIRGYWRQQGPLVAPKPSPTPAKPVPVAPPRPPKSPMHPKYEDLASEMNENPSEMDPSESTEGAIIIDAMTTDMQIMKQLDPAIRGMVASRKIRDTPTLRANLLGAAHEFRTLTMAMPDANPENNWWVSRFRLELTVDAAGRVEPVGYVGGEAAFRFEWHRVGNIANKSKKKDFAKPDPRFNRIRESLADFVAATCEDLEWAFSGLSGLGLKAHQMRMGIGVSAKGDIGVIKGAAALVGQIYFTRHNKRPVVRPHDFQMTSLANAKPILMIERNPTPEKLAHAKDLNVPFQVMTNNQVGDSFEEVVYEVNREAFRGGLERTAQISHFFAQQAKNAGTGKWKLYELRTAFDASVGSVFDLVTINGLATAQVSMWNTDF